MSEPTKDRIEEIIVSIIRDLVLDRTPVLEYENMSLKQNRKLSTIQWSYKNSRRTFRILTHLMNNIHGLVVTRTHRTRRDLYYEEIGLYGNQNCLDRAMEKLPGILKVPRTMLHVDATAKGLIAGNLQWSGPNGEPFDAMLFNSTGMLIPSNLNGHNGFRTDAAFILVVEKDAIFQKLLNDRIFDTLGKFILITGKGYPDHGTRALLQKLVLEFGLKVLMLVDNDPHGIEIAAVYKWGSYGRAQSRGRDLASNELNGQNFVWVGLFPSEVADLGLSARTNPLTEREKRKIDSIEIRLRVEDGNDSLWIKELLILKREGRKAELEALDSRFLTQHYLKAKVDKLFPSRPANCSLPN